MTSEARQENDTKVQIVQVSNNRMHPFRRAKLKAHLAFLRNSIKPINRVLQRFRIPTDVDKVFHHVQSAVNELHHKLLRFKDIF